MRFVLMCGMIGSGKSTEARRLQVQDDSFVILNDDAMHMMLHGGDYERHEFTWPLLLSAIGLAGKKGLSVIVDMPLLCRSERDAVRDAARQAGYLEHELVLFVPRSPMEHAAKRWRSDSRGKSLRYWFRAAQEHLAGYQDPRLVETWHRVTSF